MAGPSINVVSAPHGDEQLRLIADTIADRVLVEDLDGLGAVLDAETQSGPRVLSLVGHSTGLERRLRLGHTVISADDASVVGFFRRRRDQLAMLQVTQIRLLGCCTAVRAEGLAAMKAISTATGLPVLGAITILSASAYDRAGLRADYAAIYLADDDHPPAIHTCPLDATQAEATVGPLDVEALETVTLRVTSWPLVWPRDQRLSKLLPAIVDQVGFSLPGLLVEPDVEMLIPTGTGFRRVDVVLGGSALRVFPPKHPHGILYPVVEPGPLRSVLSAHIETAQRPPRK